MPTEAKLPVLPPEILCTVLAQDVSWSQADVRALSQSSRTLNDWMRTLQPHSYRQAHHRTLVRALTSPRFESHNPRAQSVLRGFDVLHLLGGPQPAAKCPSLDLSGVDPVRLAQVVEATGPHRAICLGAKTRTLAPWSRLLEAGLQAHALTTLDLAAAILSFDAIAQLGDTFDQFGALQHLHLPSKIYGDARRPRQRLGLCFAPLVNLSTLTWQALVRPPLSEVDLSANPHVRVLKLGLGQGGGLGFEGFELTTFAHRITVKLPPSALQILHLDAVVLSAGTAHHLEDAPWQHSLVELKLNMHPSCPMVPLDLRGHTALKRLFIRSRSDAVDGLVLPCAPQLEVLALAGQAMGALLRQLHSPIPLRKLHLDCRLDEAFVPGGIPWASLPNLTTLTCSARYVDTLKMELADLAIPQHSPLTRLGLAYYVQHTWEDRALRQLHLPRLRTLDLRRVDALNPAFVPQMVRSFDEALGQRTRWPALEEMVVPTHTFAPDLRAGLMDVAARHGLRLTSTSPTPDVVSP